MRGTVWTDEMIAIAAGMKRAGLTNKVIAARLGVTASAVIGKCNRVGVHRRLDGSSSVARYASNFRNRTYLGEV